MDKADNDHGVEELQTQSTEQGQRSEYQESPVEDDDP